MIFLVKKTIGEMSFEEQKKLCLVELNGIINFGINVEKQLRNSGFLHPVAKIMELKERIEKTESRFLSRKEIDDYCIPMLNQLIVWNKQNQNQLEKFWKACMEIGNKSSEDQSDFLYNPREMFDENIKKIQSANSLFLYCHDKFQENSKEKSFIYALFYAHILKTETWEYSMKKQLDKLLAKFNLSRKYDSAEIFSSFAKIPKGKGFRTDARAIRDSLAHYQYEIDFSDTLKIKFHSSQDGYSFDKTFTKEEFLSYLQNTDNLYKSQLNLIRLWVSSAVIDAVFKK